MLNEIDLVLTDQPLSERATHFLAEGRSRFKLVDCFDFVPSDYELAWRVLAGLPRGRFCEWGSGFGIVTGLAEILGFQPSGIEIDEALANASRKLLADLQLSSPIYTADYLQSSLEADVYFVYCWPGRMQQTEEHFRRTAPAGAKLLICHGQSDIRCKIVRG